MKLFMAEAKKSASSNVDVGFSGGFHCFGFGYNGFTQFAMHSSASEDQKVDSPGSRVLTPLLLNVGRISSVAASWSSTFYLKENGTFSVSGWIPGTKEVGRQENLLADYFITDVCPSWTQLAFLTKDGECVIWSYYTSEKSVPVKVEAGDTKFKAVGCRETNCILLTDSGQAGCAVCQKVEDVCNSSKSCLLFKPLDISTQMTAVACGKEHALLLSLSGDVYSLGGGSRGQLGRGLIVEEQSPAIVPALEGIGVHFVAAGGWHSAAISEFGDLYMWGWNETGQLGLAVNHHDSIDGIQSSSGQVQCQAVPVPVDIPGNLDVLTVSCGTRHTAVLAGDGSVWTWGWGYYGQLGHGNRENKYSPYEVEAFSSMKLKAKTLCCGDWSTYVIISN